MTKRDLFDELIQGFDELKQEREGKMTLKTTEVDVPKPIQMTKTKIAAIRKKTNYSQEIFARLLATNVATLRNWEQGRSEPNAQAKLLLKMVEVNPDILPELTALTTGTVKYVQTKARRKPAAKQAATIGR